MALFISKNKNTAFRSEDISAVFRVPNEKHNPSECIHITFKSGCTIEMKCKTVEEANKTFNDIINVMVNDYDTK